MSTGSGSTGNKKAPAKLITKSAQQQLTSVDIQPCLQYLHQTAASHRTYEQLFYDFKIFKSTDMEHHDHLDRYQQANQLFLSSKL